jgi:hypothetical protein
MQTKRNGVSIQGVVELVEISNNKQIPMTKIPNYKPGYDLEVGI